MRSKEVEDNKTDIMFYDIKTGIRIDEDNPQIEKGIFLDGIKITTVEEWHKVIEEFKKRENDYIHKDKIRDGIKKVCNRHDYVDNDFIYDLNKVLLEGE